MIIRDGTVKTVKAPAENRPEYGMMRTEYLSDAGGLTQFGLYRQVLEPGARTSTRHWHEIEDEFLYVLSGTPTVIEKVLIKTGSERTCGSAAAKAGGHRQVLRRFRPFPGIRQGSHRCIAASLNRSLVRRTSRMMLVENFEAIA